MTTGTAGRLAVWSPWVRQVLKCVNDTCCRAWDLLHGVETCGVIPLTRFEFESESKTPGLEYSSSHPRIIRRALRALDLPLERYAFVDMGCGKGRVLLLASELPFARIVGVEFVPQLAEIARQNVRTHRRATQHSRAIEVLTLDATDYYFPSEPQVLYFANPFMREQMDKVRRNLEASLRKSPREVIVIYQGLLDRRDETFGSRTNYECLHRERYFDIYRCRSKATVKGWADSNLGRREVMA
jgi:SAM-dependent methyltransferase